MDRSFLLMGRGFVFVWWGLLTLSLSRYWFTYCGVIAEGVRRLFGKLFESGVLVLPM